MCMLTYYICKLHHMASLRNTISMQVAKVRGLQGLTFLDKVSAASL